MMAAWHDGVGDIGKLLLQILRAEPGGWIVRLIVHIQNDHIRQQIVLNGTVIAGIGSADMVKDCGGRQFLRRPDLRTVWIQAVFAVAGAAGCVKGEMHRKPPNVSLCNSMPALFLRKKKGA